MKIEHPLTSEQMKIAKTLNEMVIRQQREYLIQLGLAKEIEQVIEKLKYTLSQTLTLIINEAGLPMLPAGYTVSADGAKLVGETADVPAPLATTAIAVNGHAAEAAHA